MQCLNPLVASFFLIVILILPAGAGAEEATAGSGQAPLQEHTLDLHTAQCLALSGNPGIAAAQERVAQARARLRQAMATWRPSVDISAGGAHQRLSDTSFALNRRIAAATGQELDQSSMHYTGGLQATWLLFDGFFRRFNEERAQAAQFAEEEALNDSRRLLAAAVAQAFLNAQLAQSSIDIAQASRTFYEKQLANAKRRYEVGAGAWSDVINIQVQLNNAKAGLLGHERELEAAEYGLASLMGLKDAILPPHLQLAHLQLANLQLPHLQGAGLGNTVKESSEGAGSSSAAEEAREASVLIAEAYALRPDVQRLEHRLQEAGALAGMAKASLYPQVRLAGALEGRREDDPPVNSADYGSTVGVNMSWNLYAGGADKARMVEAGHVQREAAYSLAALRNQIAADIRASLARMAEARTQVRLQQETLQLVEENRRLAENAYNEGEFALIQLNEAQRELTTSAGRLAQAQVGYQSARQQLLEASGRILEPFSETQNCLPQQ